MPPSPPRPALRWLDLRGAGLSVWERLLVEELLWRHDGGSNGSGGPRPHNWILVGHHGPAPHRYLRRVDHHAGAVADAVVVLGIGGKAAKLLDLDRVRQDRVPVIRRFSGGGTVVLDRDSIWTTVIGRCVTPAGEGGAAHDDAAIHIPVEPYPRPIMEWSMGLFGPVVDALRHQHHRPASSQPPLALRENDYVLGERKVAGNAQSIGKSGWLHHTSWLWNYRPHNMGYLRLPEKRPAYRGDRMHHDFLETLRDAFPHASKSDFYDGLRHAAEAQFDVEPVGLADVLAHLGGTGEEGEMMAQWAARCRTRILADRDLSPH